MSREMADFYKVRGDIAFLNGIYTAYVEELLYPGLEKDLMIHLGVDIFSIGDDEEKRVDAALADHIRNYLEIGSYDKDGNFTPMDSSDDFRIPFEEEKVKVSKDTSTDEIMEEAIFSFLKFYAISEEEMREAVKKFIIRIHWYLSALDSLYNASGDVVGQLQGNMHYPMITSDALFLKFDSTVMLLFIGYSD